MLKFLVFVFSFAAAYAMAEPLKASVSAQSAILINAENGKILFEKQPHVQLYPASITKIGTALYALHKKGGSLDDLITADSDSVGVAPAHMKRGENPKHPPYRQEPDGTHMGLRIGERLPLRALMYGLMLASGNDAANVIGRYVSGSVPQFLTELNDFLKTIGCHETFFRNPHGLHDPDHITTAFDLAIMTKEALKVPFFREVVKSVRYTRPETNKQQSSVMLQHNRLLKPGRYFYPKAIGVKTGFHSHAGHTLVGAAHHADRFLVAVLLNCPSSDERFNDAIRLFETAFAEQKVVRTLFSKSYDTYSREVKGGKTPLRAELSDDLSIAYYPSEEPNVKAFLSWDEGKLPILKGQRVGEIRLIQQNDNELLKAMPLLAKENVDMTLWYRCVGGMKSINGFLFNRWIFAFLFVNGVIVALVYYRRLNRARKSSSDNS